MENNNQNMGSEEYFSPEFNRTNDSAGINIISVIHSTDENTVNILNELLTHIHAKSPKEVAEVEDDVQLSERDLVVIAVEHVLNVAILKQWALARYQDSYYLYTGTHWKKVSDDELRSFLGKAAENIKVDKFLSRHYAFKENLLKQFYASAYFTPPASDTTETKINLANGTYVISKDRHYLKPFDRSDFMLYKLSFAFDAGADAPLFQKYLDRVLPDQCKQKVLAEYLGYVFIKNAVLKLEKALILYGTGQNGKSVLFEIVLKLLGSENVSNYSLQNLTDDKSYTRSLLSGKLLNYASEISTKLNPTTFKMLVSGEPIEARMIYGKPFLLTDYARFMFNTNVLPKDIEHNPGFFRRFIIIVFDQTISEEEKDTGLAESIIKHELPGVFNWVLEGLNRLLSQGDFTKCLPIINALEDFKRTSDSVNLFLDDGGYERSAEDTLSLKSLYALYAEYCKDSGYTACSLKSFSERLKNYGYEIIRKSSGRYVYIKKHSHY
jgi:putative DNA primase/helicase